MDSVRDGNREHVSGKAVTKGAVRSKDPRRPENPFRDEPSF